MLGDHQTFVRRRGVLAIERAVSYTPARQEAAEHVLGEFVATHRRRWWRNDEAVREATRVLRGKPRFGLAAELRSTRWSTGDFTAQEWLMIAVFVAMTVVLVAALVIRL
ncbi:MAG: hypothetical protein HOV68_09740 [Streptomycetaceae bacterium]|nr:hypothetical protein [Streptomycetaceae bacterium]